MGTPLGVPVFLMANSDLSKMLIAAAVGAAVAWVAARGLPGNASARLAALESAQQQILIALQELKGAAPRQAAQVPAANIPQLDPLALPKETLTIAGAAAMGRADAPIIMIEFSDFQCPFCSRHVRGTFDQIKRDYVDTGKLRYVFRHYPIESLHPQAWSAARVTECAGRQGKFWPLHAAIFANQKQMSDADLQTYARNAGVNIAELQACVADPAVTAKIALDLDDGAHAGVSGTPMFFIGKIENGKLRTLRRVNGADPFASFQQAFDSLLAGS